MRNAGCTICRGEECFALAECGLRNVIVGARHSYGTCSDGARILRECLARVERIRDACRTDFGLRVKG